MAQWKYEALSMWLTLAFRGRITTGDYARLHGVSMQTVRWLIAKDRLGWVSRDLKGRAWIRADWPYPVTVYRLGGNARRGSADSSIRALDYTDFVQDGRGPAPNAQALEDYCRAMGVQPRACANSVDWPDSTVSLC